MSTVEILGYRVQASERAECIQAIRKFLPLDQRDCVWLACINPHSYALARKDAQFRSALRSAQWLVPDGVGIVIASRLLGRPVQERITGFEVFDSVMRELNRHGGSVFFLGSTEETLRRIADKLPKDYPNVRLAGTYSPPFKAEFSAAENADMIEAVQRSEADVLWVGMTAPKQELWLAKNQHYLPVKFAGAIGAVFDFYTGNVKRSHAFFQRFGLEWLPRLLQQPRRLWKRMFISAPIFLFDVIQDKIGFGSRNDR